MTDAAATHKSVPLLDLQAQYASIRDEIHAAIDRVCQLQCFIGGPELDALEVEVAAYCRCRFGVGVSSGTDALLCGMMALGIGPGDEVIVPAFTFFSTAGCVARLGAKPVFVDIDPDTYNTTAELIEPAITKRTRLIVPVHLFGQCAEMTPILKLAESRSIEVMEDAAQSIGATCHSRKAGSMGRVGTLSFFPSKNLGGLGDGGMIVTNDKELSDRCRLLRNHGSDPQNKYEHHVVGGNFRLDAIQAAALRVKLNYLDGWSRRRSKNASRYDTCFANSPIKTPQIKQGHVSVYNQYVIAVPQRDELRDHLKQMGIQTAVYYPTPLHLQPCFAGLGRRPGDLPHCEQAAQRVLALPIYPELTDTDQRRITQAILSFYAADS